jgi:hypothetical protein
MDVGTWIGENPFGNHCPETDWAKLRVVCPVLSDYRISFVILLEVECYRDHVSQMKFWMIIR